MFRIHESTPDSESLVLTDHKNNYFTKIGGTKKIHGSNSRGTSRTQRPSTKNFFKPRIYRKFGVFWKACIVFFQKSNICPNKLLETWELFDKFYFSSSNFQQISALEPNLTTKFNKLCAEILIIKSTTHNVSKTLSCIKIYPLELKISSRRTIPFFWTYNSKNVWNWMKKRCRFQSISHVFRSSFENISSSSGSILIQDSDWKRYELQIIWFKLRHKICWTSLSNLAPKLKFAENWKT